MNYRSYAAGNLAHIIELQAKQIGDVLKAAATAVEIATPIRDLDRMALHEVQRRVHQCLSERRPDPTSLSDQERNEEDLHAWLSESPVATASFFQYKAMLCYMFGFYEEAWKQSNNAEKLGPAVNFMINWIIRRSFYRVLMASQLLCAGPRADQKELHRVVERGLSRLRRWARACPANFAPQQLLAEAEAARARGRDAQAQAAYRAAITAAKKSAQTGIEALALELAARHFGERGESTQAEAYLREAMLAYERWGAHAKVEHLRNRQGISTSNELQLLTRL
jgi:hypothetical protein